MEIVLQKKHITTWFTFISSLYFKLKNVIQMDAWMDLPSRPPVGTGAPHWSLVVQLFVQLSKLLQKTIVRWDVPVGADSFDGVHQRHVLVDNQVCQDQGGRAAQTHRTVDKHFTCTETKKLSITSCWSDHSSSCLPAPCLY